MDLQTLAALNVERAARRAAIVLTELESGEQELVREADFGGHPEEELLRTLARQGRSCMVETAAGERFANVSVPPPKLVAIGAVHISQALAPMAKLAGYDVTIVDPRTAFATPERFPDVKLVAEWPDEALPEVGVDRYTAFCALTHDPKVDDPGLIHAFGKECFYIGALGSRKTHAKRLERLRRAGVTDDAISRIKAPIGLDIGAQSPAEIAVAILAQVTAALRRGEEA